ncbi:MAG: 3-dehydroquinate synthase [Desulfobulbaceae bacterium]|nr:3-dehydroquinate synthase [Desulfobulbaceae bacterium]
MKEIEVGLGERSYPILIKDGLLHEIGDDIKKRNIAKRYVVVSDAHVAGLLGEMFLNSLKAADVQAELITFPRGEVSKNLETVAKLASKLALIGVDRKDALIALGGGVTGDITGFLAAVYMRGIPFIQVPTTLLSQVDSSVGGKTGVDIPEGKNLVGSFYQPQCVYIDSNVLSSLPREELLNGLAEVIKYSIIYDASFFEYLEKNRTSILDLNLPVLEETIRICCTIKAKVVEADERESGLRRILNFGHTIGHAVEAASDFAIAHGMAVAMGMEAACKLAVGKSLFPSEDAGRTKELIRSYGLPVDIPKELDRDRIKAYLKTDKKAVAGRPFFVLPTTIGKVTVTDDVPESLIDQVIAR